MRTNLAQLDLADFSRGSGESRRAFSVELVESLRRYGFFILRSDLVTGELLDAAYEQCAALFSQPVPHKLRFAGGVRGYVPFGTEHAKDGSPPDLKEFWQIGPEAADEEQARWGHLVPANIWPQAPHGFRETFTALFLALQETGRLILEALTSPLELPAGYFDAYLEQRNSVLRLIHYPALGANTAPGAARSAAHEDINLITLLPAPKGPGLELLDRDGRWLSIETDPHHLIVDSGDMFARITNDVIPATTHRVVNPSGAGASRYSMPFFMHPDPDIVLRCLPSCVGSAAKYPDILAGAFLEQRLRDIGLITDDDKVKTGAR